MDTIIFSTPKGKYDKYLEPLTPCKAALLKEIKYRLASYGYSRDDLTLNFYIKGDEQRLYIELRVPTAHLGTLVNSMTVSLQYLDNSELYPFCPTIAGKLVDRTIGCIVNQA